MKLRGSAESIALAAVFVLLAVSIALSINNPAVLTGGASPSPFATVNPTANPGSSSTAPSGDLIAFKSWDEVSDFLSSASSSQGYGYGRSGGIMPMMANAPAAEKSADSVSTGSGASDYSTTNVQFEGVDEADILKNDGSFIYTISNGQIVILRAFPPAEAKVLSTINDSQYSGLFLNGDKLVAFGTEPFSWEKYSQPIDAKASEEASQSTAEPQPAIPDKRMAMPGFMPIYYRPDSSFIKVYDVTDKSNPKLLKKLDMNAQYLESRMIGSKVYAFFTQYTGYGGIRPMYAVDGKVSEVAPTEVSYFNYPFDSYQFTSIIGLDLDNVQKEETRKIVLMGGSQTLMVSKENAYVTYTRYNYFQPIWQAYNDTLYKILPSQYLEKINAVDESDGVEAWRKDNLRIAVAQEYLSSLNYTESQPLYEEINKREEALRGALQNSETTQIHKFNLGENIAYAGKGEVPGHVLNQFSMDEYDGFFRIATTVSDIYRNSGTVTPSTNNLYVLDSSLVLAGKIEGLAPGEVLYSARFAGKRAYLVTFRQVDPLFVIGLDDPKNPTILGKLKIPGYSNYLHPYDETHLIGLGRDTELIKEGELGDRAIPLGIKLSLFDVTDVNNPKEIGNYSIGDRGSDSLALNDHKAFLFSREKNLLVIPARLAYINKGQYPQGVPSFAYGEFVFQGALVFNVSLESGFGLRGKISHANAEDLKKMGEYYYGNGFDVKRSLYLDNVLYTVSDRYVKANDLSSLEEKASVALPYTERQYGGPYYIE